MYNRYIPQSDGTFRRSRVEDHSPRREQRREMPVQEPRPIPAEPAPQKQENSDSKPPRRQSQRQMHYSPPRSNKQDPSFSSIGSFFKNLLPKDFDTADLMIVLLLLIMSGDCAEDQNTALLTLVLYLFL